MVDGTRPTAPHELEPLVDHLERHCSPASIGLEHHRSTWRILRRFVTFAEVGYGIRHVTAVTPALAEAFVLAPTASGERPTVSTMHARRGALRLLFRLARTEGLDAGDATLDLRLPPRSVSFPARPLADDEVVLCRSVAQWDLTGTRRAAAWALAEATCRSSELPFITADDLDLTGGRVRIYGGKATAPRIGQLSEWGVDRIRARIDELDDQATSLVYSGRSRARAGQVAACTAITEILQRAGLHAEPDVRAGSVAAWAGRQVLDKTGRIDLAARALGVRSLDRAASIIAWDWQLDPEPTAR